MSLRNGNGAARASGRVQLVAALGLLAIGILYSGYYLSADLALVRAPSILPFVLLGAALVIALGFEFVNGFHDTSNAVATVIYTHSLPPTAAVVWSGAWNFIGVVASSGAVAFGIVRLLPAELILQVGSNAGFAMVFALLIAAILWNLATWYLGLPASSSHTLVGAVIGVGLTNDLMVGPLETSGVDWDQAIEVGKSLLFSPLVGFLAAALLLLVAKAAIPIPALYRAPAKGEPPPWWIRAILILTCTGVSFAHGSNDGQKGMGLIMLILIGTVPAAYALNRATDEGKVAAFVAESRAAAGVLERAAGEAASASDPRAAVGAYLRQRQSSPAILAALARLARDVAAEAQAYGSLARLPAGATATLRNDIYLVNESLHHLAGEAPAALSRADWAVLEPYQRALDETTEFIPPWVKVAVALALGLGTMIGWRRIVVTVGEKIGKQPLSYAQGAVAELVAVATISAADLYRLPVSTTHVLSSGVAGTMAANRSGLQWGTVRQLVSAWILTFPVSVALSGSLFWLFRTLLG